MTAEPNQEQETLKRARAYLQKLQETPRFIAERVNEFRQIGNQEAAFTALDFTLKAARTHAERILTTTQAIAQQDSIQSLITETRMAQVWQRSLELIKGDMVGSPEKAIMAAAGDPVALLALRFELPAYLRAHDWTTPQINEQLQRITRIESYFPPAPKEIEVQRIHADLAFIWPQIIEAYEDARKAIGE